MTTARFLLLAALTALTLPAGDREEVIATVQRTFDAMAAHDAATLEALFLKDARVVSIRETGETNTVSGADFAGRIGQATAKLLERMWEPQVRVAGRLASLWAPYDFHRDGKRTHCGVDHVDLVKTKAGWRIAAIVYTVQVTGCPESPLGPVK